MAFIYQLKKYPERTIKSAILGFAFVGIGLFIAVFGPALLDLQVLAGVSITQTAMLLPARSFGYMIGSVIGGVLGSRIDHQIILIVSIFFAIVTSFCFPIFPNIIAMYVFILLGGISNGTIDTIGNVFIIHLWGSENPPFMQILHFMYGVGAFIAPVLVEPFLTLHSDDSSSNTTESTKSSFNDSNFNQMLTTTVSPITISGLNSTKTDYYKIKWPFIITAVYYLLVLIALCVVYYKYPDNPVHPSRSKDKDDNNESDSKKKKDKFHLKNPISNILKISVICISTLAMHSYVGLEISFGSLLPTFAVKSDLKMSKSEGSFVTSTYWGMYTFLRILSLVAIIYFSPRFLLLVDFSIIMFSNIILVPFANTYRWALWLGSALMGLGCSSVFATVFAFLEQLTPVTPTITSGFMIAACAGELIIPLIVGTYIESKPKVFLLVVLLYSSVSFICVITLFLIQHILLKRQKKDDDFKEIELSNKPQRY